MEKNTLKYTEYLLVDLPHNSSEEIDPPQKAQEVQPYDWFYSSSGFSSPIRQRSI